MYLLRAAAVSDLPAIMELARHLDSPTLPLDETEEQLGLRCTAFRGQAAALG